MPVDVESFQADVIDASRSIPVVVDFWAEWCGPCRVLGPVLEKLEEEDAGRWRLAKVDIEAHRQEAATWRVQGIPAVKLFVDGKVASEFTGALPEAQVRQWLGKVIPTEGTKAVQAAESAIAEGDRDAARTLLEAAGADRLDVDGRALLATLIFDEDAERAVQLVGDADESARLWDKVDAVRLLHRLIGLPSSSNDTEDEKAVLYTSGIAALREGDYGSALEAWIALIGKPGGRAVDDDGARKACIAVFYLLGDAHPITQTHRRAFSSALY